MTAVSISDSNNRVEDMEGTPTIADIGGGKAGAQELVTFLQGAASVSRKVTAITLSGTGVSVTSTNMTTGDDQVWLSKTFLSDYLDVNSVGCLVRLGSTAANTYDYILFDDGTKGDRDVAPRGGWIIKAIDPNVTAWRDATNGTPSLTGVTVFQTGCGLNTGGAKAENIFIDSIDLGNGLYLVGGDSTDPDGTWDDFIADDQGTQTAGRFGHVFTNPSGIEIRGKIIRGRTSGGSVTATVFTDSLRNIVWPGDAVAAGWNELEDDLGNATTVITESNNVFTGAGRDNLKRWFDSADEVDGSLEEIIITDHGFATGDEVLYSNEGGSNITGLTSGSAYFVGVVSTSRFALYSTRPNSYSDTSRVGITAAGTGEQHSFRRQPLTLPYYTATSNSGSATYTSCNFIKFGVMTATSGVTFDTCNFVNCYSLSLGQGTLSDCTIVTPLITEGEAFLATPDLSDISGCSFTIGEDGHAIEIDTAGTFSFLNNTFTDYWTHGNEAGDGAEFDTTDGVGVNSSTEVITTNNTHGFTTGDAAYYNDGYGSTDNIGLISGTRYYVNVISTTTLSLHVTKQDSTSDTNRVNLNNTGTGEIHALYSTKAAIVNTSGDLVTINITGGSTPYVRNDGYSTTVVNVSVPVQINGVTQGSYGVMLATDDSSEILAGYANSSGIISGSYSGATPRTVVVKARNSGIINAAIQEDNGTGFTDFSLDARDKTGSNDVDLLPASPAVDDAFYFGGLAIFERLEIDLTTAGSTYVLTWEYWNGAWAALTVVDNTNSFQTVGWNFVRFTAPSNWTTTSVNGQGPFYYIRARVTSGGGSQPKAEEISLNKTTKYLPFEVNGTIQSGTGLTSTAVWIIDPNTDKA